MHMWAGIETFISPCGMQRSAHFTLKHKFLIPNVALPPPIFNETWLSQLRKQTVAHIIYSKCLFPG